jgi:hypothetical protein
MQNFSVSSSSPGVPLSLETWWVQCRVLNVQYVQKQRQTCTESLPKSRMRSSSDRGDYCRVWKCMLCTRDYWPWFRDWVWDLEDHLGSMSKVTDGSDLETRYETMSLPVHSRHAVTSEGCGRPKMSAYERSETPVLRNQSRNKISLKCLIFRPMKGT